MTSQSSPTSERAATSARRRNMWRFALLAAIALGVFMLCASVVVAASRSASPTGTSPTFTVQGERTMQGAKLAMRGNGWPANASVTLTGSAPPGAQQALDFGTARVNAEGEFRATKLSECTTPSAPDPQAKVTITAQNGDIKVEQRVDAAFWQCMPGDARGS